MSSGFLVYSFVHEYYISIDKIVSFKNEFVM